MTTSTTGPAGAPGAVPGGRAPRMGRRRFLGAMAGSAALLGLGAACAKDGAGGTGAADLTAPLPDSVPAGTELTIASPSGATALQLELSGLIDELPFSVPEWPDLAHGPDVINAFRAEAIDLALNAGIPPIQAHYQGFEAKIVAVGYRRRPTLVFATRPGGDDIDDVEDFRGRRLAFSQGQAQGVVLLRALDQAGLGYDDVELVPLVGPQFLTALQAGQVDVAPLSANQVPRYLDEYGADGARVIDTDVVDLLSVLWAPTTVLADRAKLAAIAAYVPLWARAQAWAYEHREEWVQEYYVGTQNLSPEAAAEVFDMTAPPEFSPSWDEAIAWEQETIDLLAGGGFVRPFEADVLFDRRFETLAADGAGDRPAPTNGPDRD